MEIRTIGNASAGSRLAVDSGVVPQAAQNRASEQTAVQTTNAVPQVAQSDQAAVVRKSADKADVRQQAGNASQQANPDVSVRLASNQVKSETEKARPAESRSTGKPEEAGLAAQAKTGQQTRAAAADEAAKQAEKERTQKLVDDLSESLSSMQTSLDLSVDEDLGRVVVKIVDLETQEIIKQIPSEDALALAKSLGKMTGMFVQTRA